MSNEPLSQSCAAKCEQFWWATRQSNGWPQQIFEKVWFLYSQNFIQWSSLPFHLPHLIVWWPIRIIHF